MTNPLVRDPGCNLLILCAGISVAVAIAAYFNPATGIDGTPGALLVIASSLALCLAGIIILAGSRRGWLHGTLVVLLLLGILGTAAAATLLHAYLLLAMMVLCLAGWLVHIFSGSRHAAPARQGVQ